MIIFMCGLYYQHDKNVIQDSLLHCTKIINPVHFY